MIIGEKVKIRRMVTMKKSETTYKQRRAIMAYQPVKSYEEYLKILDGYRGYKKNMYQAMSLEEKIDFFDGIHTDHVPMFDENGNDTLGTLWDYGEITKEFIGHPDMFSLKDISKFLEMLDDDCYQPSFMDDTIKVIRSIIRFFGKGGAVFFLTHLSDVPERGKQYGFCDSLGYLIADDVVFPCLGEAILEVDPATREQIRKIINGEIEGVPSLKKYAEGRELERIRELESLV